MSGMFRHEGKGREGKGREGKGRARRTFFAREAKCSVDLVSITEDATECGAVRCDAMGARLTIGGSSCTMHHARRTEQHGLAQGWPGSYNRQHGHSAERALRTARLWR
jgi:hypothetical protein